MQRYVTYFISPPTEVCIEICTQQLKERNLMDFTSHGGVYRNEKIQEFYKLIDDSPPTEVRIEISIVALRTCWISISPLTEVRIEMMSFSVGLCSLVCSTSHRGVYRNPS